MYKSIAAYAAALIRKPSTFVPAKTLGDGDIVWGYDKSGGPAYTLNHLYTFSILGAMRAAHEAMGADVRSYNSLDKYVRQYAKTMFGSNYLADLTHDQAVAVLMSVAK